MSDHDGSCSKTISKNVLLFAVLLAESLFIIPIMVFTFLNVFSSDEDHYKTYHPEISGIVGFHFLLPIFVYQIIWLVSNIASVVTIHTNTPYIFFLATLVPIFGLLVIIVILVPSVDYAFSHNFDVSGLFLGFVCVLSVFVIILILFIIARIATFRKMMKQKKVVQNTAEKSPEDPPQEPAAEPEPIQIKDPDEISTTFSRRSTMSMNDELYIPPPRR
uniref:MARVEL domain-containing protein n=1 Tax=Caenorhabditis tropicalis TaxID=1561998 RepID=A0A1I7TRD1_9PELO